MIQRSFIEHPPHALQHPASMLAAPAIVGTSPISNSSERSRPMPRRRHDCAPICKTNVFTNTGTSIAAGVIGTIVPMGQLPPSNLPVGMYAFGQSAIYAPKINAALSVGGGQEENFATHFIFPIACGNYGRATRRGYAGHILTDCLRHDDPRTAGFAGPMEAA